MTESAAPMPAWTPIRSAAGARSPWLIASIVSIATFMEVLDISIANVSLGHIAGSLSAGPDESTWVLTSYLIANAIAVPISGWLSNIVGRKRFYMGSVALFVVASFLCGVAPNLGSLIAARILQGIGGGGLAPSEQSILTDTFAPEKRGGAYALYGLTVIAAPILGPTFGGLITDSIGWHWVFLINVPIGLLSLYLVHRFVVDPPLLEIERQARLRGAAKVDAPGIVLLVCWLGCLEYALDRGEREDWFASPAITAAVAFSVVACVALWIWEWRHDRPVFDVRLFASPSYSIAVLVMLTTGAVVLGTTQLVPALLQQVMGYTASDAGAAMTLGGLATVAVLPLAGILSGRVQPKWLIAFGLVSEALALWAFTRLHADASWWWLATSRLWLALGIPFLFIPINTAAYAGVAPDKVAQASAQLNLARNLGGSIAISVATTVIARRSQFHQSILVEQVNPFNPLYSQWTEAMHQALVGQGSDASNSVMALLSETIGLQARTLAYIDAFWILALAVAVVTPCVLFMQRVDLGAASH